MSCKKVLFINHNPTQCGVYQFGKNTGMALSTCDKDYSFIYGECKDITDFNWLFTKDIYAVIFNHHPSTMPWLDMKLINNLKTRVALIMHDERIPMPGVAVIHPDPTFVEFGNDFKVRRLLLNNKPLNNHTDLTIIGSFGFGFQQKGFPDLVKLVNSQFTNDVYIRLHLPFSTFGDINGQQAISTANVCREVAHKNVTVLINHDYMSEEDLLFWLSQNTINIFNYKESISNGISSAVDWAISACRPIAVTKSIMFRHVHNLKPSICLEERGIQDIIDSGLTPLEELLDNWTPENLIKDYIRILDKI